MMSETIVHPGPLFDLMIDREKATTRWRRCQLIGARKWLNCPGLEVNSYLLDDGRPRWSNCARRVRPFQFSLPIFRGNGQGCPRLRASNEHSFTVRVLRARRAPGRSRPILLRPRVARAQEIIRLHPLLCSASRRITRPRSSPLWSFSIPQCNFSLALTSSLVILSKIT